MQRNHCDIYTIYTTSSKRNSEFGIEETRMEVKSIVPFSDYNTRECVGH